MTPLEALASATAVPARVMGVNRLRGQIATGMIADLFLVEGRPDEDISAVRSAHAVIRNGDLLDPKALWRAAGFVP